ncbi:MAG: PIN domain-containing protein, partial [Treponema sp.]
MSFSGISHQEQNNIKAFLSECPELQLTKEVKEKTIEIRKHYKTKLPDAIIAATAIVNQTSLITADKAFEQIEELNLVLIKPNGRRTSCKKRESRKAFEL